MFFRVVGDFIGVMFEKIYFSGMLFLGSILYIFIVIGDNAVEKW